ncbi:UNVERIFIED_CONTAM: hypothetical protein GTU68_001882 [Idotea baltica]|nr:hypothetical protein [Idotea baltica]
MAYSEKVIDHYENPRNVGSFEKDDPSVGSGMVGAPACGDVMKLQIKVSPEGIIEDAKFKTYGCGSAIASSSLVTEWVKGKTLDEAAALKNAEIAEELELPPVKVHCSILAEDAIKAAVLDYLDELNEEDEVFEEFGVKIIIDPKSLAYMDGTELDFAKEGLNEGFQFNNPNVKSECGCGESFNV